jgi:acyl-[acyl-carrier-protein]-phospholipid O-acyltransferase/long-chain-fatty-acid--[acyl-carrier-protein] ligase
MRPPFWVRVVQSLLRFVLRLLYRVEVKGEFQPSERTLIVCNHQSYLDPIILGGFLPVWPTWLIHMLIVRMGPVKPLLRLFHLNYREIDTKSPLSLKSVVQVLETGAPVVIFPEGRITVTGSMMKIYEGPAFAAAKADAYVVPVHIEGPVHSPFAKVKGDFPRRWFPKVTITYFPPRKLPMPQAPNSRLRRQKAAEQLRRVMQEAQFATRKRTTLPESILDAMEMYGRKRLIIEDIRETEESYAQLVRMMLALGRLASRLTDRGERVGLLMPNTTPTVGLIFGLQAYGRVPAMLNYTAGAEGIRNACHIAELRTIITSHAFIEKGGLQHVIDGVKGVNWVYLEDLRPQFSLADKIWLMLYALRFPRKAITPPKPEDAAVVLFTSGSEGKPKGVVLSHDAILANVHQARAVIEFSSQDKFMTALPLFHAFGLTVGTMVPLAVGARVFLYPSPLHYRVVPEIIYDRDCTVMLGTGTFLSGYAKYAHPYDMFRIRHMIAGAEKLNDDVRDLYMDRFGVRILEGYGATECAPCLAVNTPMAYRRGSVGELLPGMEAKLFPIPGVEGGELHVRGPNLMLGYLRDTKPGVIEPPKSQVGDGWYNTGDIVNIDENGFIRIVGRLKRFAKVAGEMVSLEVVEKIAVTASPGSEHASSALPDSNRGEAIVLFTQDSTLKRDQLQAAARNLGLPELAIPRKIVHVERIPLLPTGKKDYVTIKKMAEDLVTQ